MSEYPLAVIAPILVPLVTAILALVAHRTKRPQQAISLLGGVGYVAAVAYLFQQVQTDSDAIITYQLSNWGAPFGISLVADDLAVFMLALAAVVSLAALAFSVLYLDESAERVSYHPLFHFMLVGVSGSFLTGDIFNLFVWFEVMLMSSYVLVVFYSGPQHTKAALQYVTLNLVGSALMLVAIGGLYATTGTLNMADLARRLANPAEFGIVSIAPVLGLSAVLFVVFALKAGIVPFQWWVPAAYRAAPAPVAAVLAGVVKKVGVYAIIRLYFTIFANADTGALDLALPGLAGDSVLAFFGPVLFVMAGASILVGGIGAVNRDNVDDLLAYSSIGQVGFIVLALAFAATAIAGGSADQPLSAPAPFGNLAVLGIAAALVYSLNHALAKGALFLVSGAINSAIGTIEFDRLGGLANRLPFLSAAFFLAGLGLVGIPPFLGFFGKFLVFDAAVNAGSGAGVALALAGAILTIAYFTRAWNRGFWGVPSEAVDVATRPTGQVAIVLALALSVLLVGAAFDPVVAAAIDAAQAATNTDAYIEAVHLTDGLGSGNGGGH
ncbi:complex I subunit 5 family protein [Haloarchaeobius sp. TZWSO28]|uniref:complex I subunit 5 family protein n=1 Tax=Haloarchaeobius sp. TZWSO28 TaxID=3446119 RepID=UPI003EB9696C